MIIKERKYEPCPKCGSRKLISDDEYGCDYCKNQIDLSKPDSDYLRLTVFKKKQEHPDEYHFCSWNCVFKKLKMLETDDFISLPFLLADTDNSKINIKAFWKAMKQLDKK
jgi:hypothetical protein